jgi:hypothetical protein
VAIATQTSSIATGVVVFFDSDASPVVPVELDTSSASVTEAAGLAEDDLGGAKSGISDATCLGAETEWGVVIWRNSQSEKRIPPRPCSSGQVTTENKPRHRGRHRCRICKIPSFAVRREFTRRRVVSCDEKKTPLPVTAVPGDADGFVK